MAVADGPPELKGAQRAASAPDANVWLSASAGTGKTHVLMSRVLRLLLSGADPGGLLCLTFTKAGAAEMASRVNERLARWVRLSDGALGAELQAIGESGNAEMRREARKLFARVLDAPGGGIRIQTIHGFCQSLLASFPAEAGIAPGFRPIEARAERVLQRETLAALLVVAEARGDDAPTAALGRLSLRLGEEGAERFLLASARAPDAMATLPLADLQGIVRDAMAVPRGDVAAAVAERCDAIDPEMLRSIAAANAAWGTATGLSRADLLAAWLANSGQREEQLGALLGIARTGKGELRKVEAKLLASAPDYSDWIARLGDACADAIGLAARAAYADALAEALTLGQRYAADYAAAKARLGLVDFDDLIRSAEALLSAPGMGEWVRYKLDRAIDHILVDESQDTNAAQWRIVEKLADEFFAHAPDVDTRLRTVFTVGDTKQAIFGFQGTDPAAYRAAFDRFAALARPSGRDFDRLSLTHSFRTVRPVLQFVDAAMEGLDAEVLGERAERHDSEVPGPGRVELWPAVTDADLDDGGEEGWVPDAVRTLADRIAAQVAKWIADGEPVALKGRALTPGDVMILVRKRGALAALLVARLHAQGVPVAGVDRLRLTAPLAVRDLLSAVRFVLQPGDDLNLAALLVSPLIGWDQDRLYAAARRDEKRRLWDHLRDTQDAVALAPLNAMLTRADFVTPYRFLEELLSGPLGGRAKLLARLGEEARDPIEELLNAALLFESGNSASLQGFLDWFDRGDVEIVRDPSAPGDAVRVMTVHGAKGLQAPFVILADAAGDPDQGRDTGFALPLRDGAPPVPAFMPRKDERAGPVDAVLVAQEARDMAEHWRLFYVAMTRAEERLVLAGALGKGKSELPANSWARRAADAFDRLEVPVAEGAPRVFTGTGAVAPARAVKAAMRVAKEPVAVPEWALRPAPQEARPPRPLSPSSIGVDDVADAPPTPAMRAAAERGRWIHALLERLPQLAADERAVSGREWLRLQGADAARGEEIVAAVCGIIADPAIADLFGADSLAEAPIAATLPNGMVVAGTVDRLLVTADLVRVIDFKTGRVMQRAADEVPAYHLRQMAAYAAALSTIFPGRPVEAALLYTAGPRMIDLPPSLLDAHKPDFASAEQSLAAPA